MSAPWFIGTQFEHLRPVLLDVIVMVWTYHTGIKICSAIVTGYVAALLIFAPAPPGKVWDLHLST